MQQLCSWWNYVWNDALNVLSGRYSSVHHWWTQLQIFCVRESCRGMTSGNFSYLSVYRSLNEHPGQTASRRALCWCNPCLHIVYRKIFGKNIDYVRVSIVDIAFCEREIQQFTLFVTDQMKLESKNQPIVLFPLCARSLNTLFEWIRLLWHTLMGVLSTYVMPVHSPNPKSLSNSMKGTITLGCNSTKRL